MEAAVHRWPKLLLLLCNSALSQDQGNCTLVQSLYHATASSVYKQSAHKAQQPCVLTLDREPCSMTAALSCAACICTLYVPSCPQVTPLKDFCATLAICKRNAQGAPSLLQLVPAVTELIIAELLYLQYRDRTKPMFLYINSTGTSRADGETVSTRKRSVLLSPVLLARPAATCLPAGKQKPWQACLSR